jgi:DNA ligase (NAD+)
VLIEKAGEIIPQVRSVTEAAHHAPFAAPTECPSCGTALVRLGDEVALRCPNRLGCPAQRVWTLAFFAGRGQLDVDGLGLEVAAALVERGLVKDVADLFGLREADLRGLPHFAEKRAKNLIAAIRTAREQATCARLIAALGIPSVGGVTARALAERFRSLGAMLAVLDDGGRDALYAQLIDIDGFGDTLARSVVEFFEDAHTRKVVDRLIAAGLDPVEPERAAGGPLTGKVFVVTGTLTRPRPEIIRRIEDAGGKVTGSVSKKTDYLVAGADTGATKMAAAEKHGVKVIGEAELDALCGSSGG